MELIKILGSTKQRLTSGSTEVAKTIGSGWGGISEENSVSEIYDSEYIPFITALQESLIRDYTIGYKNLLDVITISRYLTLMFLVSLRRN